MVEAYEYLLKDLVCKDIPDTRKLQELRIQSIGEQNDYEDYVKQHFPQLYSIPRIILLPLAEQQYLSSSSLPLSFAMADCKGHSSKKDMNTRFNRWTSGDFQKGAMHLTTEKGLSGIVKVLGKNGVDTRTELAFGPIFGVSSGRDNCEAGISAPHSWYVDTYDPWETMTRHQFVICNQDVLGIPFFFVRETKIEQTKHETGDIAKSNSLTTIVKQEAFSSATFHSSLHQVDYRREIMHVLEERAKEMVGERTYEGSIVSSSIRALKIGEPIVIYDPKWIEPDHKPSWTGNHYW